MLTVNAMPCKAEVRVSCLAWGCSCTQVVHICSASALLNAQHRPEQTDDMARACRDDVREGTKLLKMGSNLLDTPLVWTGQLHQGSVLRLEQQEQVVNMNLALQG